MLFRKKRIKPSDFHVSVDVTTDSKELDGMNIDMQFEVADKATIRRLQAEDKRRRSKFVMPSPVPSTSQLRHQIALTSSSPFFPKLDKATAKRVREALTASFDAGESSDLLKKRLGEIIDEQQTIDDIVYTEPVYCYQASTARYGELTGAVGKEWHAGYKCCDECERLDGKRVSTGSRFESKDKLGFPPLHKRCTCNISVMY